MADTQARYNTRDHPTYASGSSNTAHYALSANQGRLRTTSPGAASNPQSSASFLSGGRSPAFQTKEASLLYSNSTAHTTSSRVRNLSQTPSSIPPPPSGAAPTPSLSSSGSKPRSTSTNSPRIVAHSTPAMEASRRPSLNRDTSPYRPVVPSSSQAANSANMIGVSFPTISSTNPGTSANRSHSSLSKSSSNSNLQANYTPAVSNTNTSALHASVSSAHPPGNLNTSTSQVTRSTSSSSLGQSNSPSNPRSPSFNSPTSAPKTSANINSVSSTKAYSGPTRGLVGLQNLGNTCFMNSALQCLFNTPPIIRYFLSDKVESEVNTKSSSGGEIALAFRDLIKGGWLERSQGPLSPVRFKREVGRYAPRFMGYSQQDAHEFLRFLLDGLHSDLNRVRTKQQYIERKDDDDMEDEKKASIYWGDYLRFNNSVIIDIFCGQLKSCVRCDTCSHKSACFDPFLDLSIPIPKTKSSLRERFSRSSDRDCNLSDCLNEFMKEEILDGDEKYSCNKCKRRQRSIKKITVWRLPHVLVIHLKRFSNNMAYCDKVSTEVSFPVRNFDLSPFVDQRAPSQGSALFDLIGVSIHSGSLMGGHYTANCLNMDDNQWYCFNDGRVSLSGESGLQGSGPYILFYKRQTT